MASFGPGLKETLGLNGLCDFIETTGSQTEAVEMVLSFKELEGGRLGDFIVVTYFLL